MTAITSLWSGLKSNHGTLQGYWGSAHKCISHNLVKGMPSGSSHCGWIGLKWEIYSYIPISSRLWIPCFMLNQIKFCMSNLLTVGHLFLHVLANQPDKLLDPFLPPQAITFNAESLLNESMSINSTWSNFMFLLPLSHSLNIHSHTCSPDFGLYKLENSSSSFGV